MPNALSVQTLVDAVSARIRSEEKESNETHSDKLAGRYARLAGTLQGILIDVLPSGEEGQAALERLIRIHS